MNEKDKSIEITLRIPGGWSHPGELIEQMPNGFRLTPESLVIPSGTEFEFSPMPPDDQFAAIFASSCRQPPTQREIEIVNNYTVNVGLIGPGGSMDAARSMMQAASAIIEAGGAGVFIDNCGLAHGGENWNMMAEDGGTDAVSFAFVGIVRGKVDAWTMGMHVLGMRDIVMKRADIEPEGDIIIETIRYLCESEKPVYEGHILADETGPRFQAIAASDDDFGNTPMHNPLGRLRLVNMKDIAESN